MKHIFALCFLMLFVGCQFYELQERVTVAERDNEAMAELAEPHQITMQNTVSKTTRQHVKIKMWVDMLTKKIHENSAFTSNEAEELASAFVTEHINQLPPDLSPIDLKHAIHKKILVISNSAAKKHFKKLLQDANKGAILFTEAAYLRFGGVLPCPGDYQQAAAEFILDCTIAGLKGVAPKPWLHKFDEPMGRKLKEKLKLLILELLKMDETKFYKYHELHRDDSFKPKLQPYYQLPIRKKSERA